MQRKLRIRSIKYWLKKFLYSELKISSICFNSIFSCIYITVECERYRLLYGISTLTIIKISQNRCSLKFLINRIANDINCKYFEKIREVAQRLEAPAVEQEIKHD